MNQKQIDSSRKTYRLHFPADLTPDQGVEWLTVISGTLQGSRWKFKAVPSLALEVFANQQGIQHRIRVPRAHEKYVIKQLRLRGINVEPETEFLDSNWMRGAELRMTRPARQLRRGSEADTSHSILVNFQSLDLDESLCLQIIVSPAGVVELPVQEDKASVDRPSSIWLGRAVSSDEFQDVREKLSFPNLLVEIRVVAHASTGQKAEALLRDVEHSFKARRGPGTGFERRRSVRIAELRERVHKGETPFNFHARLSAPELVALSAWPYNGPFISGLAPAMTRHMPPTTAIPSEGRIIGTATFHGDQRPIAQPYKHAVRHSHYVGPNGTGKTTLMENGIAQDMDAGYGVFVVETKGDLFHRVLDRIPDQRLDDVYIIDVNDRDMPVGFNILDQGGTRSSIGEIGKVITELNSEARSITSPKTLYYALSALAEVPGHTFVDLPKLLDTAAPGSPQREWQDNLVQQVKNAEVKTWLQGLMNMSPKDRDTLVRPLSNRTWEFTDRPEVRNILGQRSSSFKMTDIIEGNKILLINLAGPDTDPQTAMIMGTLFTNAIWQAARQVKPDKANFLWLDEFQDIARFPVGLGAMLAKARAFNLGLVLAHQHTGQLTVTTRDEVMANTATKVVFQTTSQDAGVMARNFMVKDTDFMNLTRFQTICKVATDDGMSPPVTVATKPEGKATGNAQRAIQLSRQKIGRPLEDVERGLHTPPTMQMAGRRRTPPPPSNDF